jgi:hypothetical protein
MDDKEIIGVVFIYIHVTRSGCGVTVMPRPLFTLAKEIIFIEQEAVSPPRPG